MDPGMRLDAADVKRLCNYMSYRELVAFACQTYPDEAGRAGIAGMYEGWRLESAVSLARRHAVSISKAAEIAGMDTVDFEDDLKGRGIPPYYLDWKTYARGLKTIRRIMRQERLERAGRAAGGGPACRAAATGSPSCRPRRRGPRRRSV